MSDLERTFVDFLDRLPFYGMAVVCGDDERVRALIPRMARRAVTYGTREGCDFRMKLLPRNGKAFNRFEVAFKGQALGEFHLFVPGMHNVLNATAAVAVGVGLDISPDKIRLGLEQFRGVDRRFQVKGIAK